MMDSAWLRVGALVAGILAATPAAAFTIKVTPRIAAYQDTLVPAVGTVVPAAGSAPTFTADDFLAESAFNCASNAVTGCVKYAPAGAVIVLQASPGANTTFIGWSNCTSVSSTQCTIKVGGSRTVTANFKPTTYEVHAATWPQTTGTWTPPYGGRLQSGAIDCQTSYATSGPCVGTAANGAPVVFTAVPTPGSVVSRWAGCAPLDADPVAPGVQIGNTCVLTASGPTAVSVGFAGLYASTLKQVSVSSPPVGRIISGGTDPSAPDYVNCPGDCIAYIGNPGSITLRWVSDREPTSGAVPLHVTAGGSVHP
jgi:hypothetical protein